MRRRSPVRAAAIAAIAATALVSTALTRPAHAQQSDSADIIAVAQRMFDAMRTRDTSQLRSVFDPSARLVRVTREGAVRAESPDGFIQAVARSKDGPPWVERFWDPEVRIDDKIAQLWVKYDFHLGEKFSHCGIDAFQLAKTAGGWKITQLADTQRQTGCTPPAK
ncbi:MAG TPA: nuclear transport factor 2 family protein [Gemmatimonadaceae bacterium]|nr:nuclear transport factor 2 family protein [Gemmatimonadaceae bacterium]